MLKFQKSTNGACEYWTLSGVVDEHASFEKEFDGKSTELTLTCREIERINSVGVLLWRRFFSKLRKSGVKLKFKEVAPPILLQTGSIADLILKDELESLQLHFTCSSCRKVTGCNFSRETLKDYMAKAYGVKCQSCGGDAVFEEMIEEYTRLFN